MKSRKYISTLVFVLALNVSLTQGDPPGPTWPPPGGCDWAGSGISPGHTGGLDWQYYNFDFVGGRVVNLWWGTAQDSMGISLDDGPNFSGLEILTFAPGLSTPSTAVWTGQSRLTWYHRTAGRQTSTIDVRFSFTFTGGAIWIDPGPTGVTNHSGIIAQITGDYVVNILATGNMPDPNGVFSWVPINVGFDRVSTEGSTGTAFSTGFWYELIPVPGDMDDDYDVDLNDHKLFVDCLEGGEEERGFVSCAKADLVADSKVNLLDFSMFQVLFTGPG